MQAACKSEMVGGDLETALHLAREAIAVLDQIGAPADIAAHIDHAVSRMEQLLGQDPVKQP